MKFNFIPVVRQTLVFHSCSKDPNTTLSTHLPRAVIYVNADDVEVVALITGSNISRLA
ncbi:MAG: hypothetical protein IT257_08305 [Chitinophagaceae bacterium]|nr:hypothetical protein [Chitinophagaceae bacterium]